MKRYQVYLNPESVYVLDKFEKLSDISRSKMIRAAVDRLADMLIAVISAKKSPKESYILD